MKPRPGTYALIFATDRTARIEVGRAGFLQLRPGYYIYVGSALGPGGLRARVARHRSLAAPAHWHVDHLKTETHLLEVWFSYDEVRREHQWAALLGEARGASLPLRGFGASDCACPAHLVCFASLPSRRAFSRRAHQQIRGHPTVHVE